MNKIFDLIKKYKYLLIIIIGVISLLIIIVASLPGTRSELTTYQERLNKDGVISVTKDFMFYREKGNYYVEVSDPRMTDETIIRNTLNIDPSIPIIIYVPGAANRNPDYNFKELN